MRGTRLRLDRSRHRCLLRAHPKSIGSDSQFKITNAFETADGAIVVQVDQSSTVTGPWRSMETSGQRIEFPFCDIFRFDSDGRILLEEAYYDMLSV